MRTLVQKTEAFLEWGGIKKEITLLAISGVALVVSIFDLLPFDAAWVAIVLCGIPIVLEALIGLITAFDIKADVLVSLALIAAVLIGEDFAAGEVAFIMQLGALLEDVTVARARAGIEKLVHLTPQTARLLLPDGENIVPAEQVRVGDRLRVLPGESIPVDGVITSGQTSINQAVMTGESLPVDKTVGDEVSSGTVNQYGAFEMRATKVGEDSSIQRMIRLVQSADAGKARIVGLADRWATWIVVIALTAAALTWLITGEIIRAVTILVVFCPCALVLATPTAIMAAIGNATRHGFLVGRATRWSGWPPCARSPLTRPARSLMERPGWWRWQAPLPGWTVRDSMRWRRERSSCPSIRWARPWWRDTARKIPVRSLRLSRLKCCRARGSAPLWTDGACWRAIRSCWRTTAWRFPRTRSGKGCWRKERR